MSERVLVMALLLGLGLEAWRGWGQSPNTPLPPPYLFSALIVVFVLLGIVATFSPPLAAVLAIAVLIALALGVTNPLLAQPQQKKAA